MQPILDLVERFPWLVPLLWSAIIWPLVSGLALTVLDRYLPRTDEEWSLYFELYPRRAALVSFLKTAGFNLPGTLRSVRSFFAGPPPELPSRTPKGPTS